MQFWNELEGRIIDNLYPLRRLVRSEGRTAWFETETHDGTVEPATISLTESLTDADEVTSRLEAAQRLKDPNLIEIHRVGTAQLDQTLFVYAIMEPSDQNLSEVLRDQALPKDEARQVAEAMVGALTAIHKQGLTHGRVEPASILSVGEAVKLRSDCLQSPGATRSGDVAGIGDTLFQCFTQRKASAADDAQINRIPAPFAEIVRNALSARWSLAQITAALRPPSVPLGVSQTGPATMPVPTLTPKPAVAATERIPSAGQPAVTESQIPAPSRLPQDDEAAPAPAKKKVFYAAVAIAFLATLAWIVFHPKAHTPAGSAPHAATSSRATPAPVSAPKPSAAMPAMTKSPVSNPVSRPNTSQVSAPASGARSIWRVVAYTYRHQDQAQHKADEISHAHSDFQAAVFSPSGDLNHFLVVLGGAMNRKQAFEMLEKARHAGVASDAYVQNFVE